MENKRKFIQIEEMLREAEDLWISDIIDTQIREKLLDGYKLHKEYRFGKYEEISLNVWKNGSKKLYEVINNVTGVVKLITKNWNEAYGVAKQLAQRYRIFNKIFGE